MHENWGMPLEELLDGLRAIPEPEFSHSKVTRFLRGKLVDPDTLAPYAHFSPHHYTRNLVFKNELFELLVVCWGRGQGSPIHNHSGQLCWLSLQQGWLCITSYREIAQHGEVPGS